MIDETLFVDYIPDDMLYRYFNNESDSDERFIVENLKQHELNIERFLVLKKRSMEEGLTMSKLSNEIKNKMIDYANQYNSAPENSVSKKILKIPAAGQIWTTKRIFTVGNNNFVIASPMMVYLLTNPEVFPIEDEENLGAYNEYKTLRVLVVSLMTSYSTQSDYIIDKGNPILNFPFMIQTSVESNMLVNCLDQYLGELNEQQVEELLSIYEVTNSLPDVDQEIYNRAAKGVYSDDLYGDNFEYKLIESKNIKFLSDPVNQLYQHLAEGKKNKLEKTLVILYLINKSQQINSYYRYAAADLNAVEAIDNLWDLVESEKDKIINLLQDKNLIVDFLILNQIPHLIFYCKPGSRIKSAQFFKGELVVKSADEDFTIPEYGKFITPLYLKNIEKGNWIFQFELNGEKKSLEVIFQ